MMMPFSPTDQLFERILDVADYLEARNVDITEAIKRRDPKEPGRREKEAAEEQMRRAMARVFRAQARGVKLEGDLVAKTLEFIDNAAPDMKTSMQRDVEAGRPSELESLIGVVPRLGRQSGVSTPVLRLAYAVLKPGNLKAPGS